MSKMSVKFFVLLISILFVVFSLNINICETNSVFVSNPFSFGNGEHISGVFSDYTLFTRNTTKPKSYTVTFKYIGDPFSRILNNARISTDARDSYGWGDLSNGVEFENHHINLDMHIKNATNFWVNITMGGTMGIGNIQGLERWLGIKVFRPRSSAVICAVNEKQPKSLYRTIEFGQRMPGDFILRAKKEHFVSKNNELPRYLIEFNDDGLVLTSVLIKLNTTQAIIFNNKIKMTEHKFSGTIYGLDRNVFTIIYIVYGHKV